MCAPCNWANPLAASSLGVRYVDSVSPDQLQGSTAASAVSDCTPLKTNGSLILHPCGLVANTFFNDVIELTSGATMDETGIAWESDIKSKVRLSTRRR